MKANALKSAVTAVCIGAATLALADEATVLDRSWSYTVSDGKATIIGVRPADGEVTVPVALGEYPVEGIGVGAFIRCAGLTSVAVPTNVASIAELAFYGCSGLMSVQLASSVSNISDNAFAMCGGIVSFAVDSRNAKYASPSGLLCSKDGRRLIRGVVGNVTIPTNVTHIADAAFCGCRGLVSVSIPTNVTHIGKQAFDDTAFYDSQHDGLLVLGHIAYGIKGSCPSEVIIPAGVTIIDESAFGNRTGLVSVMIPSSVRQIGEDAFGGCSGLSVVYVGSESEIVRVRELYAWPEGVEIRAVAGRSFVLGEPVDLKTEFVCCQVGGLPPGLRYDMSTGVISGAAKSVGEYLVTFVQEGARTEMLMLTVGEEDVAFDPAALVEAIPGVGLYGSVKISADAAVTGVKSVSVSGQPKGMKFDRKTSCLAGTPSKSGEYTMKVTVTTVGGTRRVFEVSVCVAALPDAAVGKFYGFVGKDDGEAPDVCGSIVLTAAASGKLTAKVTTEAGSCSLTKTGWDSFSNGVYSARMSTKKGETLDLELEANAERDAHQLVGTFATAEGEGPLSVSAQRRAFAMNWHFTATGDSTNGWTLASAPDAGSSDLSVTVKADGSTSLAGKLGGTAVKASGSVDVSGRKEGVLRADFVKIMSVKSGRKSVKKPLYVRTDLWFGRQMEQGAEVGSAKFVDCDLVEMPQKSAVGDGEFGLNGGQVASDLLCVGLYGSVKIDVASAVADIKSVSVSGQPKGMKFDKNTFCLSGIPSKSGEYAMKVTVTTVDGVKQVFDMPVSVAALPDVAVGTFVGFVGGDDAGGFVGCGTISLVAAANGKLKVKVTTAAGNLSLSAAGWNSHDNGIFSAVWMTKKGERLDLTLDTNAAWDAVQLTGVLVAGGKEYVVRAQRNAFAAKWYYAATGDETNGWTLGCAADAKSAALTLRVKADGSTSLAGKIGEFKITSSGVVDIGGLKEGAYLADFLPKVSARSGRKSVKRLLFVGANLWFDRKSDHEEGHGSAKLVK